MGGALSVASADRHAAPAVRREVSCRPPRGYPAPLFHAAAVARYKKLMGPHAGSRWPPAHPWIHGLRFIRHLPQFVRLYWRLLRDGRVSVWPKALLLLSVVYAVSPIDLVPDVLPVIGQVDDLLIVIVACRLFMYMCPRAVVQEHVRRIDAGV